MSFRVEASAAVVTVVVLLLALLALGASADAAVVVPISDADLVAGADVIVLGRVTGLTSHADVSGEVSTYVTLAVDEVLKGALTGPDLTIRESGGTVGVQSGWVSANPEFVLGEPVLLFLDQRDDGTLRTYHFYLGKFTIVTDPGSGDRVAIRAVPPRVTQLPTPGTVTVPFGDVARGLDQFTQFAREHAFDPRSWPTRPQPGPPFLSAVIPPDGAREDREDFRFMGDPNPPNAVDPNLISGRWTGPDSNVPVTMRMYSVGQPQAPSGGYDQVRLAFRAWSRVPTASFRFAEGPVLSGNAGHVGNGINTISFNDPAGQISNPAGCSGVLATTWVSWFSFASMTVNGRSFGPINEADLVVADGWNGCGFYESFNNFTEVITHELGHALGLGHSADTSATMYAYAHFDGRANVLPPDDRAGVTFIYPGRTLSMQVSGNGSVSSVPDGISCPPDCAAGFGPNTTVTLTPVAGAGATFTGFSGAGCGSSVTMSADRSCTATFASGTPGMFQDVLTSNSLFAWIQAVAGAGIATGCSTNPPLFCPDAVITRSTMAGWLLRGIHGAGYVPPPATGIFADVSSLDPAAPWIEELLHEGITSGCGANPPLYCPSAGVTRGQMAVFLLRAKFGKSYVPPPAVGTFTDVPTNHVFAGWIEELAREGITTGCGPTTYCPDTPITRGQMAVFVQRAFNIPM